MATEQAGAGAVPVIAEKPRNKLLEPSTWAGIGVVLGIITGFLPHDSDLYMYVGAAAAAAGSAATFMREKGKKTTAEESAQ